jgi:hypothetical protein
LFRTAEQLKKRTGAVKRLMPARFAADDQHGMASSVSETGTVPQTAPAGLRTAMPLSVPLLLSLPAWIPLAWTAARAWRNGQVPTAFVQYDLAAYLANGRQHFADGFHLAYGNPYAGYGTPQIYFEPHLFLLGFLQWLGLSPDLALILFGVAAMAFTSLVAGQLYQAWVGWRTPAHKLGFACFFWGGGLLSLGGALFGWATHSNLTRSFFVFDPGEGWWMLNFGRNLVAPTEAYYHGLFLLAILLLIRRQFAWTVAVAALLSASHPFTGISLALVLAAYAVVELILKSGAASWLLLAGSGAVALLHAGYYLVFLNRFPDHRALEWSLDWPYMFWTYVPALYLVGVFAFGRLTRWKNLRPFLADPRMRLGLVWFTVIFALTQHDLVMPPQQPIHFAHGYDWMALFLLATPALLPLIEKLLAIRRIPLRTLALAGFLAVFLSDNLLWFASFRDPSVQRHAIALTREQKGVLDWLAGHAAARSYVASSDPWINYLTPTYTNVRGWSGHDYNTPHGAGRKRQVAEAFAAGKLIPTANPVYYIPARELHWTPPAGSHPVYENRTYQVWLYPAASAAPR